MDVPIDENNNSKTASSDGAAANRISENTNSEAGLSATLAPSGPPLDELCEAALKRRGRRGRPKGSGQKHPENCQPKTFRNFSPMARALLAGIRLTGPDFMSMSEGEIVEEALVRYARTLSNQNPQLAKKLEKTGR